MISTIIASLAVGQVTLGVGGGVGAFGEASVTFGGGGAGRRATVVCAGDRCFSLPQNPIARLFRCEQPTAATTFSQPMAYYPVSAPAPVAGWSSYGESTIVSGTTAFVESAPVVVSKSLPTPQASLPATAPTASSSEIGELRAELARQADQTNASLRRLASSVDSELSKRDRVLEALAKPATGSLPPAPTLEPAAKSAAKLPVLSSSKLPVIEDGEPKALIPIR